MSEKGKALIKELCETANRMSDAGKEMLILKGNTIADYEEYTRAKGENECSEAKSANA